MERRVLVAIFLCFLVLYAWQAIFVKPVPKPAAAGGAGQTAGAVVAGGNAAPDVAATAPAAAGPTSAAVIGDTVERDIRVETADVIAVFTNRGARLRSWQLKHFLDPAKRPQELVENPPGTHPLPFTLRTPDEPVNSTLNTALYSVAGAPAAGTTASGATTLTFEYSDTAGVHAVKEFRLAASSYVLTFHAAVTKDDKPLAAAILWGPGLGDRGELTRGAQPAEALLFEDRSARRLSASDIGKQPVREGTFNYAGVDDNYFLSVALAPGASKVTFEPVSIAPPPNSKEATRALIAYTIERQQGSAPLAFFIGPKDLEVLKATHPDLGSAINFGRFAVIVVPLLGSLKWVHSYVGNWGWSIVILTMIISGLLSPLQHKQVVSMRKMQELQPQIKAIQDRYSKLKATDPAKQKMNTEMMALYREKKVNPASGCVPMLLTFPVLFAMWALLQTSIELRGAPWFGWIHDLSTFDPYYVLPVLMTATSYWQTRMTPAAGADPAQQKMMAFMPLVMGFIFIRLPSGALIYYVVSNVWRIGQQYLTNYLIGPPVVRTVRPAAERRVKRVGGGKTDAARREEE
ncbi:MAG: membrane protein insertase YidC [Acidobacteriota bacterium]